MVRALARCPSTSFQGSEKFSSMNSVLLLGVKSTRPLALTSRRRSSSSSTCMKVANLYRVRVLPSSLVIDRKGALSFIALGPREWDKPAAHQLFESLLK